MSEIIDGVDVSECNMKCDNGDCALYYAELNNDNNELIYGFNCSDNQDCYYKQLQRAKAENKELERKYADVLKLAKDNADSNEYCLQELEKENEQLKADIESRTMCITCERELQNCNLQAENERLKEELRTEKIYSSQIEELEESLQHAKAENERLKEEWRLDCLKCEYKNTKADVDKYRQALQEIRDMIAKPYCCKPQDVIAKINEVIGAEE